MFSEEHKRKIGLANKGKVLSEELKKQLSKANKGKHFSPKTEFKKGLIPWNKGIIGYSTSLKGKTFEEEYGIERAKEMKRKMSESQKGKIPWWISEMIG